MNHECIFENAGSIDAVPGLIIWDLEDFSPITPALAITLLREQLATCVIFRRTRPNWILRLTSVSLRNREARFNWYGQARLDVEIAQVELERWQAFFLKYYRDGVAEVDHFDVSGLSSDGSSCELVVKVGNAAPPVSGEEARRRLGLG